MAMCPSLTSWRIMPGQASCILDLREKWSLPQTRPTSNCTQLNFLVHTASMRASARTLLYECVELATEMISCVGCVPRRRFGREPSSAVRPSLCITWIRHRGRTPG